MTIRPMGMPLAGPCIRCAPIVLPPQRSPCALVRAEHLVHRLRDRTSAPAPGISLGITSWPRKSCVCGSEKTRAVHHGLKSLALVRMWRRSTRCALPTPDVNKPRPRTLAALSLVAGATMVALRHCASGNARPYKMGAGEAMAASHGTCKLGTPRVIPGNNPVRLSFITLQTIPVASNDHGVVAYILLQNKRTHCWEI